MIQAAHALATSSPPSGAVLIADDHPLFRDALAQIVGSTMPSGPGHRSRAASMRPFEALSNADFELILLDVNMPGMNGMAGLLSLRNTAPATPVVIVSGKRGSRDGRSGDGLRRRRVHPEISLA